MRSISASDFKTHCLALLDEVSEEGETLIILKRGRPVARLISEVPAEGAAQATLLGTARATDDLLDPPLPEDAWEALQGR